MELSGRRVLVVGLGVSGRAAARFLSQRGASLMMTDREANIPRDGLPPGELHLGGEDAAWLKDVELAVVGPGVSPDSILMRQARKAGLAVVGEVELAARFLTAPIIAITGTNGKSTVTTMVGQMLRAAGLRPFVGGNLGTPLVEAVGSNCDAVVAEISSFQLETIEHFRPSVAVYLNLAEDHLDRYRTIREYGEAKARLFENQLSVDWAVLNRDDPNVWALASRLKSRVMSFGFTSPNGLPAISADGSFIHFETETERSAATVSLERFPLPGCHNVANAMAAAGAAFAFGVGTEAIERSLSGYYGLPHRLELVRNKDGVTFIDDSKATNVASAVEALRAVRPPIVLIAGGTDKGGAYTPLRAMLAEKVKLAILIGAARFKMNEALDGAAPIELRATLAEAIREAAKSAAPGDSVLLAPACSSFDQFRNYAERGNLFKALVESL
jgi:UDP-N-acetylmuramoylalanine--D-glutamate ligase